MIRFIFFLDSLDFGLDFLELFLTLEHLLLWDEEYHTDDERDDDDSPPELMSRYPGDESNEEVIDRLIYDRRNHRSK